MEKLHYPSAKEWMWNYCMYLGPYKHEGRNYDLGVYVHKFPIHDYDVSLAIVYGNEPGNYISGAIQYSDLDDPIVKETVRRAKYADIITE